MRNSLDQDTLDVLSFLEDLCEACIIDWPVEFEVKRSSAKQLAKSFEHWFGNRNWASSGHEFVQFGQDVSGSLYLLWFYPGLSTRPPVVFLGSEGEAFLVSDSIEDFARQLGSGELFFIGAWQAPDEYEVDGLDWAALRQAIQERFGRASETPNQMTERARTAHPDFPEWVESMLD